MATGEPSTTAAAAERPQSLLSSTKRRTIILPPPVSAPELLCADAPEKKLYWDRSHYDSPESQLRALAKSSTVYVGNLAFSTRSAHLSSLFKMLGPINAIHLGLDRFKKTPCGFAFVEYARRSSALKAVSLLTGSKLDGRVIRVELDAGFKPGRQYGRGVSGGQVRDDRRGTFDPARTGGAGGGGGGRPQQRTPPHRGGLRWEAPNRSGSGGRGAGDSSSHYGPPSGGGGPRPYPSSSSSGDKRKRDDDHDGTGGGQEDDDRAAKNPRFRDEGGDDHDDL